MPSAREPRVFVVIPSYNEGGFLRRTVDGLLPYGYEIVVVDDGSTVDARSTLGRLPIHFLRHSTNLGQGAALETGTEYAVIQGADVIVHFDADGQHDSSSIAQLIRPVLRGECDVVIGSRFLDPRHVASVPFHRRIVLKVGIAISWLFTGVWLSDTHNGLRALSGAAASKIRLTESGFAHATEILSLIKRAKLRYREFPTLVRYTAHSKAKGQSGLNGINIVFDLVVSKVLR